MATSIREFRRSAVLEAVTDYFLEHGLGNASLRSLAAAVGTSDRMLLYYFADKDELMLAAFECVVQRLSARLGVMLPEGRQPFDVLLSQMWLMLKAPEYKAYMRVWYDALGRAAQGEELYREMANRVLDIWLKWFEPRLAAPPKKRGPQIAAIVAASCGLVMLRYIGREDEAELAADVLSSIISKSRDK